MNQQSTPARLAEPELGIKSRLNLVNRMCQVLNHDALPEEVQ
jgi:hypothetical protein